MSATKNICSIITLALGLSLATLSAAPSARADESVGNQVKDTAGDASTSAKKTVRHAKKKARKAAGTDTAGKDVKDKANDVGDDVSNNANKLKRKAE